MNTGAFGEGFPYSNFHDLNMDWIVKIAKDFLDQYSHIQETIQTGLNDLDTKAEQLEALLQAWYDEHSEDIAQELTTALEVAITSFNAAAETKAAETIASIPSDYTALTNHVNNLQNATDTQQFEINRNNTAINNVNTDLYGTFVLNRDDFELGNITIVNGVPSYPSSPSKIRTKQGISFHLKRNARIYFDELSNYNLYFIRYGDTAVSGSITTSPYIISTEADYGFVISDINDAPISDITDVMDGLSITQPVNIKQNFTAMLNHALDTPILFEIGSVSGQGLFTNIGTRCRSEAIKVSKNTIISIDYRIDYDISATYFNEDMTIISDTAWNKVIVVPDNCIAFILGRKSDNTALNETDIENIKETLRIVPDGINQYWNKYPELHGIAHSGGYFGPRNTLPAYIGAFNHGFKFVETDVAMTADNVFVCIHGAEINQYARYPDGSELEQPLYVYDLTYEELLQYDFGLYNPSWGDTFRGTKIATLEEVAKLCNKLQMHLFVDITAYNTPFSTSQIGDIMNLVNACGLKGNATFCCDSIDYAESVYANDKTANISCVFSAGQWFRVLRFYSGKNAVSLNSLYATVTQTAIDNCKAYKIPMITGMLDTEQELEDVDDYINGIVSDNLCVEQYWKNYYTE